MRRWRRRILLLTTVLAVSCSPAYVPRKEPVGDETQTRQALVKYAKSLIGAKGLTEMDGRFKNDCSGFVNGVYAVMGRRIKYNFVRQGCSLSESLYLTLNDRNLAYRDMPPRPADAVFFKNTLENSYDKITHVGLVEEVLEDGTVVILHYGSGRVGRLKMNLRHPYDHKDDRGEIINDYLRKSGGRQTRDDLAGALFFMFGNLFRFTEQ
ncbi:CHAP domain-containing protein [candidate division TA06 bacterium]|uniref:CHAP domain-containing protein n=1 Tax=candidate division TA06 bacterium TaxID=2250710 RepID=A0A933IB46_UNCT6|nr:CHAP domain-containing protein [candidate division TA06 bacterium]